MLNQCRTKACIIVIQVHLRVQHPKDGHEYHTRQPWEGDVTSIRLVLTHTNSLVKAPAISKTSHHRASLGSWGCCLMIITRKDREREGGGIIDLSLKLDERSLTSNWISVQECYHITYNFRLILIPPYVPSAFFTMYICACGLWPAH